MEKVVIVASEADHKAVEIRVAEQKAEEEISSGVALGARVDIISWPGAQGRQVFVVTDETPCRNM